MRVLVTGGASGLGAALAAAFLDRGDEVLIGDLNEPTSSTTGNEHTSSSSTSARTTTGPLLMPGCPRTGAASTCS